MLRYIDQENWREANVADSNLIFDPLFRIFTTTPDSIVNGAHSIDEAIELGISRSFDSSDQVCICASDRVTAADRSVLMGKAWICGLVVVEDCPSWVEDVAVRRSSPINAGISAELP
jgi:hypothetical protein